MIEAAMSPLEAVLWYLSLPVLYYLAYRFVLLNLRQYEKLNPPPAPGEPEATPAPEPPAG